MHNWKEWIVAFGGWQRGPSPSSSWFPPVNLLKGWRSLSFLPPSSPLLRLRWLVRQDLCLREDTVLGCIYLGRQPPSMSVPGNSESSSSSPHLKAFCCVLSYCPRKFCAELNTKHYIVMLSSSGNDRTGKQTLKHKAADEEVSVHNRVTGF